MISMTDKPALRRVAAEGRRRLAVAAPEAGCRLADMFPPSLLERRGTASGYWPMRDEIDVRPLMRRLGAAGWRFALPVVLGAGRPLLFRSWSEGDVLVQAAFGQFEPAVHRPVVTPDLLLVPLLAFDRRGGRLGYGGGFYDRTLAALRAAGAPIAMGVGYAGQERDSVPQGPHDQRLDWVLTEREALVIP